ncbi:UNVERIFIED_CONTAM: hypothetical protein PYX00_004247 [Menopon gallinae]|uniref:Cell division cycle protein 16 homolog n=1 Tax=Menopon gallinae TaxID=328185 RepID=A0AAW2I3G2_9NEOP
MDGMDTKLDEKDVEINISYYRRLVQQYLELHRYNTALFWADKVHTLSNGQENDVYWLAQAMYLSKQYHRAAHLIRSRNLHLTNVKCCYLAASSLREAKEYTEAMELLYEQCSENTEMSKNLNTCSMSQETANNELIDEELHGNCLAGSMHFEQGRVYESMDNRDLATECYKQALLADVHCYEAFDALIQHQMMSDSEEQDLINSLPFSKHCATEADSCFVRYLYESKLNKYRSINKTVGTSLLFPKLEGNLDLMVSEAEKHYYNCNYTTCWKITEEVMSKDPYHLSCLPVHISCLVELKNSNDLFLLAHRLVDIYPERAVSWFAVGCYYYVIGNKSDNARRFLGKATSLDKLFGPAWLAYGHSFAAENEHDQAMAAYFKASQLMKGCHLPLLYIGLENGLTNNSALAEKFFQQAQAIAPDDPFVTHEMGVIAFQSGQYELAKKHFEEALERMRDNQNSLIQSKWEPLLNNLGHVYRKLQNYEKAIEFHKQAMVLSPNNPSTYSAIGYCYALLENWSEAAKLFHKALALKRDDTFSTTMLNCVLQQMVEECQDPEEPDSDLILWKQKSLLVKDIFDCDELMATVGNFTMNSTPVPDYIPLDGFSTEEIFKSSNSGNDEANNSTKLSCEMELQVPSP